MKVTNNIEAGIPLSRNLSLRPPSLDTTKFQQPTHELPVVSPLAGLRTPLLSTAVADHSQLPTVDEEVELPDRVYTLAALYVDAALHGRKFEGFKDNEFVDGPSAALGTAEKKTLRLRFYRMLHSRMWRLVYTITCCVHVALACVERPSMLSSWASHGSAFAFGVEWCCVAVYCVDIWLYFMVQPTVAHFFKQHWRKARIMTIVVIVLDLLVVMSTGMDYHSYRFSRGLRPFMLLFRLRNLRKVFAACLTTLRRAALIFWFIAFLVVLFGCVGFAIMNDIVDSDQFNTAPNAMYHLLLLQTTFAVFASELDKFYAVSKWTGVFYVLFSVIGNLMVSKMIIAVGYESYRSFMSSMIAKHIAMRDQALSIAFRLLTTVSDGVTLPTWLSLCKTLKRPDPLTAKVLFQSVCTQSVGKVPVVSLAEFAELCMRVNAKAVALTDDYNVDWTPWLRSIHYSRILLQQFIRRSFTVFDTELVYFDVGMSVIVSCSMVCVITAIGQFHDSGVVDKTVSLITLLLLVLFCVEIAIKLYAYGPSRYWRDGVRRLDIVVTFVGVVDVIMFGYDSRHYSSKSAVWWFHICNAVRCLRLLKAFAAIQVGATLSRTMMRILPAIANIMIIILSVCYALSLIGLEWYSGHGTDTSALTPDNPRLQNDTDWQAVSSVMQFNDLATAMLTMFEVANVANWYVVMNAASRTGGIGGGVAARAYFFIARILLGMLLLPIFFGFVIEAFNNNIPVVQEEQRLRREAIASELKELQRALLLAEMPLPREKQSLLHESGEDTNDRRIHRSGVDMSSSVGSGVMSLSNGRGELRRPFLLDRESSIVSIRSTESSGGETKATVTIGVVHSIGEDDADAELIIPTGNTSWDSASKASSSRHTKSHNGRRTSLLNGEDDGTRYLIKSKLKTTDIHAAMFAKPTPTPSVTTAGDSNSVTQGNCPSAESGVDKRCPHELQCERLLAELESQRSIANEAMKRCRMLQREVNELRSKAQSQQQQQSISK